MDSPNAFQSVVWIRSEHRSVFLGWPTRAMNGAVPAPRPLGSERLRLPPQIRSQPTHPVRQSIAWFGFRGLSHIVSTGCTSSTDAMGYAYRNIQMGVLDTVVTGGVDSPIAPLILRGFQLMRIMSTSWNKEPTRASRPFSKDRDGFVLAEGSWFFVMAPRGVRRCRRTANRPRSGTPTAFGRLRPDPRGGREVGHFPWLALGRLSFGDHVTGVSVARLSDGHRAARGPWCSRCTSLRLLVVPALEVPGTISKPKGAPRKYQDGPSSCAGCAPGRMGIAWTPVRQGVGIIAAWFAPGCGSIGKQPAAIRAGTCFTAEPAKLQRE